MEFPTHCTPLLLPCAPTTIGDRSEHETEELEKLEKPSPPPFSLYSEARSLAHIALPTVFVQFCTYSIYPQCASVVGRRLDTESLAAFSLGSLSANMTCTSIIIGTLSASETLQPRAFALKRHEEVGRLAVRGFFVCLLTLLLPVFFLSTKAEDVFDRLGQDAEAGHLASRWIHVYIWSVVPLLAFRVAQRWLASQNVVLPAALAAGTGCFVVHPPTVEWAVTRFGFVGSAYAIAITQTSMCVLCIAYVAMVPGSYERSTRAGLSPSAVRSSLRLPDLMEYARLGIGGVFALSEWWFWECICFLAGRFGLVELCVHTVAYQSIPIAFMVPLGVSIGLSVRMGNLLPVDVDGAKRLAAWTTGFTTVGACLVSAGMYRCREWIVSVFTTDEEVEEGCRRIWFSMCVYNVLLWYFCVSRGILSALGLQWRTAANMFVVLWVLTIPAIVYSCVYEQKGYYHMWKMVPLSYTILNAGLTITYMSADWEAIGARIKLERKLQG